MSRNIITSREINAKDVGTEHQPDAFVSKLVKLIPADIVAVYLAVFNLLNAQGNDKPGSDLVQWIVFGIILGITPFYLKKAAGIKSGQQIIFCTVSFVVWVFTLGGPIEGLEIGGYSVKFLGAVFLPIYTLFIPLFYEPKN